MTEPAASTETTTPPTEDEAPKEEAPAVEAPVALTAEDLTFPEGFTVADELRDKFLDTINNSELSTKDRAAALINLQAEAMTAASEASSAAWNTMQDQWRAEVKADPEIGGDKLQPALDSINRLVTEYGNKELVDMFALTGAGNNVHMVKFLSKMATHLTEGGPSVGSPTGGETTAAQRMYPSMKG